MLRSEDETNVDGIMDVSGAFEANESLKFFTTFVTLRWSIIHTV